MSFQLHVQLKIQQIFGESFWSDHSKDLMQFDQTLAVKVKQNSDIDVSM